MFSLPNTVVGDQYIEFNCPRARYIIVNVYNGGVYCGVGNSVSGRAGDLVYNNTDLFLAPGSNPIFGADGLRFRRADPTNANTQVTVQAQLDAELPHSTSVTGIYTPNYLVLERDGRVSADFSGIVRAAGVTLPPSLTNNNPSPENAIQWLPGAYTGRRAARIYGVEANPIDPFRALYMTVGESAGGGQETTRLRLSWIRGLGRIDAQAQRDASFQIEERTILDGNGWSSFVQWALTDNPYRIDIGTRGGPGTTCPPGVTTINYRFNRPFPTTCLGVISTAHYVTPIYPISLYTASPDPASFTAFIYNSGPGNVDVGFTYLAIGY